MSKNPEFDVLLQTALLVTYQAGIDGDAKAGNAEVQAVLDYVQTLHDLKQQTPGTLIISVGHYQELIKANAEVAALNVELQQQVQEWKSKYEEARRTIGQENDGWAGGID